MKRLILVSDSALRNHFGTFGALCGESLLVARHTVNLVLSRYKRFRSYRQLTRVAFKALLVKLLTLVLHFFSARFEYLLTHVTTSGKFLIIALGTVE